MPSVLSVFVSSVQHDDAAVREAVRRAKLRSRRFHYLRPRLETLVASDPGTSERELQACLGHLQPRTMERYRHYRPQKRAARHIVRIFKREIKDAVPDRAAMA
jgi:integrase